MIDQKKLKLIPAFGVLLRNKFYILIYCVSCMLIFSKCDNPVKYDDTFQQCDTSFSIGDITFPNDTIYKRSIVSTGSNWRMQQFISKCRTQKNVKIGFIGGSITAGAIASNSSLRYSSLFCNYVQSKFPNLTDVNEINAGIGATGSRFGCSRVVEDLLESGPEMIVIEFAVNDWAVGDSIYIKDIFEGLVRQCLLYKDDVPVVLLFMSKGDGTNVQLFHEEIGRKYSLPMISYRDAIWPIIDSKKDLYWNLFFHDDPHPNDNGHKICAFLLYSYFKNELVRESSSKIPLTASPNVSLYESAGILHKSDTLITVVQSGWNVITKEKERIGLQSIKGADSSMLTMQSRCKEMTVGIHMQSSDTSSVHIVANHGVIDTIVNNYSLFEYTKFITLYASDSVFINMVQINHFSPNSFSIDYILYAGR